MLGILNKFRKPKKPVAIVTPIYRLPLTEHEEVSLRHLRHYLSGYDRFIVAPKKLEGLALDFPDFKLTCFEDSYFESIFGYNKLMLSTEFYAAFSDYEYVLIYQLDCLVFSSDLEAWCHKKWDYVGAPWFEKYQNDPSAGLWGVGNGGLSLRHIQHSLEALKAKAKIERMVLKEIGTESLERNDPATRSAIKKFFKKQGLENDPKWFLGRPVKNEDRFWGFEASQLVSKFHVPTPQEALGFSFECAPRYCFDENNSQLPFGCHAWARYDLEFWKPYLLGTA